MDRQPITPAAFKPESHANASRCPVCAASQLSSLIQTKHLALVACTSCGHRMALHSNEPSTLRWDQPAASRELRVHQARLVLQRLEAYLPKGGKILDCGTGDGLFLQTARDLGYFDLAGIDARPEAIESLKALGYEAALAPPPPISSDSMRALCIREFSFRPRVITWFDVVDRFQPNDRFKLVDVTLKGLPEVDFLVVKLPMADGLFHRSAEWLARIGRKKMLDRVYEAHSPAPRIHGFTRQSARLAITEWGLTVIDEIGVHDFEPPSLARKFAEALPLRNLPQFLNGFLSNLVVSLAHQTTYFDSRVYICRRNSTSHRTS